MLQKTKNHQNQGSIDKKFDFFHQSLSHIPRWVHLVQKNESKKFSRLGTFKGAQAWDIRERVLHKSDLYG